MEQTADQPAAQPWHIEVRDLAMAYGDRVVLSGINFTVKRGEIFIIMGGSGSGKSTLLRHMVGLIEPATGEVLYNGVSFTRADPGEREAMLRRFGILYQGGALWSSMTLAENVGLPLAQFTRLRPDEIREVVSLKLAMVGLKGFEDFYPSELSGGMRKRGGLARAIALDPEVLFFDEPSSGLDPLSARLLDDLILELRASLGATVVVVSHDLASIFAIGDGSLFLDAESGTAIAQGNPRALLEQCEDPRVHRFLTRGQEAASQARNV
jgi:phospholipid/cholesterol/gamma-HCH transport system ATP-binding protein